jgi:hypothetical protein
VEAYREYIDGGMIPPVRKEYQLVISLIFEVFQKDTTQRCTDELGIVSNSVWTEDVDVPALNVALNLVALMVDPLVLNVQSIITCMAANLEQRKDIRLLSTVLIQNVPFCTRVRTKSIGT